MVQWEAQKTDEDDEWDAHEDGSRLHHRKHYMHRYRHPTGNASASPWSPVLLPRHLRKTPQNAPNLPPPKLHHHPLLHRANPRRRLSYELLEVHRTGVVLRLQMEGRAVLGDDMTLYSAKFRWNHHRHYTNRKKLQWVKPAHPFSLERDRDPLSSPGMSPISRR
jgi:hypothetical protein